MKIEYTQTQTLSDLNGSMSCNILPRLFPYFPHAKIRISILRGETRQWGYFFLFFISSYGPTGSKDVMDLIKKGGVHFASASVSVLMATYNGSENRQLVFVP